VKNRIAPLLLAAAACGSLAFGQAPVAHKPHNGKKFQIVLVAKVEGYAWFDNMRLGVQKFGADHAKDVDAYQVAANTADPAAQVALINDLIAKKVDAIIVVPNDPAAIVPALKKANDAGILTFTHESSGQKQVSYDLEAFDNDQYGRHMMDVLAASIGGSGLWQPFVGHVTSPTHNQWVDGEVAQAKAKYPGIKAAADRLEDGEDQQVAYQKSMELLTSYPNLKAIMGSAMSTVPGAAQAITEQNLVGKVAAYGTCLPSVAGDYIKSGAVKSIHFWVPADAGYTTSLLAYMTLTGKAITPGADLKVSGYNKIQIKQNAAGVNVVYGQAWVDVNKDNLKNWLLPNGKYKL